MKQPKLRRTYMMPEDIEKALGLAAIDTGTDRGELIAAALRLYLPTVSNLPPVQAIAPAAGEPQPCKAA